MIFILASVLFSSIVFGRTTPSIPKYDDVTCKSPEENIRFLPDLGVLDGKGFLEGWELLDRDHPTLPYNVTDVFETTFKQDAVAHVRRYYGGGAEADRTFFFGETVSYEMEGRLPEDPSWSKFSCTWDIVMAYFAKGGHGLRIDVENLSSFTAKDLNSTWTKTSGPNYNGTRSFAIVMGYPATVNISLPQANTIQANFIESGLSPGKPNFPSDYGHGNGFDNNWCIVSSHAFGPQEADGSPFKPYEAYFATAPFPDPIHDCFGFRGFFFNKAGGYRQPAVKSNK